VTKINGKWFITPVKLDLDIPPDQFISNNGTGFSNMVEEQFLLNRPIMMMY
jgi:hypothetical protein